MKNVVIILENLPDDLVKAGIIDAFKALEIELDKPELRLDWSKMTAEEQARIIEALIKFESSFALRAIMKMPPVQRSQILHRLHKEGMEKIFKNNFGDLNLN